jgi:cytochrome c oxidase assembly protein subunit 15
MSLSRRKKGVVVLWLAVCCILVFSMIILGGVTRLTHSGLSMVDWDPIMGVIPPLNETDWRDTFERYKAFPEYQIVNKGMTLEEFKRIFYYEYAHRVLGRSIGLVFLVPFLVFLVSGMLNRPQVLKLSFLLLLGGAQGLLGWYMVKSGLIDVPRVSAYRLTAHLMLAVFILGYMLWLLFDLGRRTTRPPVTGAVNRFAWLVLAAVAVMIASGGFVAGTRAGFAFNTFPLMHGRWVPEGLWAMQPLWTNLFENVATVQFFHRGLAAIVTLLIAGFWLAARRSADEVKGASTALLMVLIIQLTLGVSTLLYSVPVSLAAVHQGGALVLFCIAVYICHTVSGVRQREA